MYIRLSPIGVYNCCVTALWRAPSQSHHVYLSGKRGKQLEASVVTVWLCPGQGVLSAELS